MGDFRPQTSVYGGGIAPRSLGGINAPASLNKAKRHIACHHLYKGWLIFSQPLRLLVAVSGFVVAEVGTAPGGDYQVGN